MNTIFENKTPLELGYRFPAEWEKHKATWLSYPHKEASWPERIELIFPVYSQFIALISQSEQVCINVTGEIMKTIAHKRLEKTNAKMENIQFFIHPTNDAWCRDHGGAFLVNPNSDFPKALVNWRYNAWGNKYPPYDLDDQIPLRMAEVRQIPVFNPNIIMEGGAIEVNGKGALLTTTSCLLNPNRNRHLNKYQVEKYLIDFYGQDQIIWLEGTDMEGDDTDGHIDQLARFVSADTVVAMYEPKRTDENYESLKNMITNLNKTRLLNDKYLNVIELEMPTPVFCEDSRLPASYANFCITNRHVIVPTYRCENDQKAIDSLQKCFPDRQVVGLDSTDISWGLGSFHCLSQQEPA